MDTIKQFTRGRWTVGYFATAAVSVIPNTRFDSSPKKEKTAGTLKPANSATTAGPIFDLLPRYLANKPMIAPKAQPKIKLYAMRCRSVMLNVDVSTRCRKYRIVAAPAPINE